uniref:GINS subunit domain-containing protein n=1 Tax=Hemiselmis andersenii TaxID=464988 RepID=A0A7S1HKM5_HEMAN|mmetsp:Transcript_6302/g.15237  ORF Transcript_6302/g.15237 Transcript_6302/m.15237 type:complete len:187 (+) Transcript_6302:72-632(+)|eukprot:CAMPEP_0114143546 /NCGR_PEP_ID=MMETSP0043_2-20121206/19043_1 /TAXON_ID=464988 /ORGANISM="Hemiselmis andersenii, Strain CCMP644" /LENGTH=186 /DNA_ID=CAMNT_0001237849 /DNA_START=52 /DNA_END=612 /DNA_ORIENTATION=+
MPVGDYYSLDSILREETPVPVEFQVRLTKGLANILDAPAGEVKELPLWLARALDSKDYVYARVPRTHSKPTLAALKVDASKHSLSKLNPYYYEAGIDLSIMTNDAELVQALMISFARRYKDILERYDHTEDKNAGTFIKTLTSEERRLYVSGQRSSVHHSKWKRRMLEHIEHAPITQMSNKKLKTS